MKAMLHVHTCFSSDGELTPRTIGRLAKERGFDAVLLADHYESLDAESFAALREECRWVTNCLLVPGLRAELERLSRARARHRRACSTIPTRGCGPIGCGARAAWW